MKKKLILLFAFSTVCLHFNTTNAWEQLPNNLNLPNVSDGETLTKDVINNLSNAINNIYKYLKGGFEHNQSILIRNPNKNSNYSIGFENDGDGKPWYIGEGHSDGRLFFRKQGIRDALSIRNDGNVSVEKKLGIGTINPSEKLEIYGGKLLVRNGRDLGNYFKTDEYWDEGGKTYGEVLTSRTKSLKKGSDNWEFMTSIYTWNRPYDSEFSIRGYPIKNGRIMDHHSIFASKYDKNNGQWHTYIHAKDLNLDRGGDNDTKIRFDTWKDGHWIGYDHGYLLPGWRKYNSPWWMQFLTHKNEGFIFGNVDDKEIFVIAGSNSAEHNPFSIGDNSPKKGVIVEGASLVNGKLIFGDGTKYGSRAWPTNSDPYYIYKVRHSNNNSELRMVLGDDGNELFSIYGDSCSHGGCGSQGWELYRFPVRGELLSRYGFKVGDNRTYIQGTNGRNVFEDSEKAGRVRVGGLRGIPGIYSEDRKDLALGVANGRTVLIGGSSRWAGKFNWDHTVIEAGDISLKAKGTNKGLRVKSDGSVCIGACW